MLPKTNKKNKLRSSDFLL